MTFGLPDTVLQLLQDYFNSHPQIITVFIYGSRAMGKETPGSDIDLALITNTDHDISGTIQSDLDALPTPYLFDVIDYQRITHQPLRDHVDRVGKIVFQRAIHT
ncbi:MAG: nucleotidyltransferase domain-containing protein [Simkaniaceae bacterium]|nr:nucleotidyltransferase domain-containing protein [Simkaniaceae bacterium]